MTLEPKSSSLVLNHQCSEELELKNTKNPGGGEVAFSNDMGQLRAGSVGV